MCKIYMGIPNQTSSQVTRLKQYTADIYIIDLLIHQNGCKQIMLHFQLSSGDFEVAYNKTEPPEEQLFS